MTRPPLLSPHDLPAAIGLLTRLPMPVDAARAMERGASAAWAYPLVGVVVAGLAGMVFAGATWAGVPHSLATGLVVLTLVALTGALHEDGLADTVDGIWGGWTRDRRLEIMKDSRIGAYGVLALVFSIALRWAAINGLEGGIWAVLIGVAVLSRGAMVLVWATLPPARPTGLSARAGQPSPTTALLAAGLALSIAFTALGPVATAAAMIAALLATSVLGRIALRRIGGQTGDILGATQQVSEIAILLVLVSLAR